MLDCCYERDTPNMSRAISLKRGEKCFNVFSEYVPFIFMRNFKCQ